MAIQDPSNDILWINGKEFPYKDLVNRSPSQLNLSDDFEYYTVNLIRKWLKDETSFELMSSGTTGQSKVTTANRDQLSSSAIKTIEALELYQGINAVLCLNSQFTAGIMFIIRALIGKFKLFALTPSANPLINLPAGFQIDLISLVPNQLWDIIKSGRYNQWFNENSILLLGGGPISSDLEIIAKDLPGRIIQTFGMAETLSHIALRNINGDTRSEIYETVKGVSISANENNCLVIKAPHLSGEEIITRDMVEVFDRHHFIWKGRYDHVIQSGGIKITVEWLEKEIETLLHENSIYDNFFIASLPDPQFGEKIILIIENKKQNVDTHHILRILTGKIARYEMPKEIFIVNEFDYTLTMKIDREKTVGKIKNQAN